MQWIPGRCKACGRPVYWHVKHGWCEKPSREPVKHECPKERAA